MIPRFMKAAVVREFGRPLAVEEIPIVIRVAAPSESEMKSKKDALEAKDRTKAAGALPEY